MNDFKNVAGINFLRLKGTDKERAALHGKYLKDVIPTGALEVLANRNQKLLRHAGGLLRNKLIQNIVVKSYDNVLIPTLKKSLKPNELAIFEALSKESNYPMDKIIKAFYQADGIMLLSRLSIMKNLFKDFPARHLPGCSSAIVNSSWTKDNKLLVLRNQDYPVVGPWEKNTTVIFNEPTEPGHIPHISVTSAGLHSAGLTSMNKEGITVAAHAHFGKEVSLFGSPVFMIGNEIINKAKSLNEAVDIARKHRRFANWTLVVSSAKENSSVAIEMTPSKTVVRDMNNGFMSHTNFFHNKELNESEALINGCRHDDDFARLTRIYQLLQPKKGEVQIEDMVKVCGDHVDPWSNTERVFGNTVSVMSTVKSVVFSPEDFQLWVSTRKESPVGLGDFIKIDGNNFWDSCRNDYELVAGNKPKRPDMLEKIHNYRKAYVSWHMDDTPNYKEETYKHLINCLKDEQLDGHLYAQAGILSFQMNNNQEAYKYLKRALEMDLSSNLREVTKLFIARCYDLNGKRDEAKNIYQDLVNENNPNTIKASRKGLKTPYNPKDKNNIMIDFQFPEPIEY